MRATVAVAGIIASLFILASGPALAIQCPIGSYEWIDSWGNAICKSFGNEGTQSIEGSTTNCPTGTYKWVDNWGNSICKSFNGGNEYIDTSKGCPVGYYQWVDSWGNQVCKAF